jgi:hypothetical protein
MTLLWCDGFDGKTADLPGDYTIIGGAVAGYQTGRFGGFAFGGNGAGASGGTYRHTIPTSGTIVTGYGFMPRNNYANSGTYNTHLQLWSGGTDALDIRQSSSHTGVGGIGAYRNNTTTGGGGTLLGSLVTGVVPTFGWHYFEVKVVAGAVNTGSVEVKIDGVVVLSLTGQNTGSASYDGISMCFYSGSVATNDIFDDWWVTDGNSLGDCRVLNVVPTGAGTNTGLTASTGTNWSCVDEIPPTTADYVSSITPALKDTYAFSDVAGSGVLGAVARAYVAKTDAGTISGRQVAYGNSTYSNGSDVVLTTTPQVASRVLTTHPDGSAWSVSNFNAAEFGWEVRV